METFSDRLWVEEGLGLIGGDYSFAALYTLVHLTLGEAG